VGSVLATAVTGCVSSADMITPVLPGAQAVVEQEVAPSDWPEAPDPDFTDTLTTVTTRILTDYLALTDTITAQGGEQASAMAALTTSTWFTSEQRGFDRYREDKLRTIGQTVFHSLVVQSLWEPGSGGVEVDVVACIDATGVWLLPADAPEPPEGLMEWIASESTTFEGEDEQWLAWSEYLDTYQPQPGVVEAVVVWLVGSDLNSLRVDGTANWEGGHSCDSGQE
jgi:hypothetical protein